MGCGAGHRGAGAESYLGSGYLLQALVATFGQSLSLVRGMLITMATSSVGLVAGGLAYAAATYRWVRGSGAIAEGAVLTRRCTGFVA